jgi:CDP-diacylglycerol--serine O-phosphatidyltransferase
MNRKIAYAIPNLFTVASLGCALVALNQASNGAFVHAAWLITLAMVFDGFDGKMARWLNATSKFGAYADTLADFVAFGVVPGFLAWEIGLKHFGFLGYFLSILYVLCGGYRLARFSIQSLSPSSTKDFTGLPIPAAAGTICSFILFTEVVYPDPNAPVILLCIVAFVSFLMVSRFPYIAVNKRKAQRKYIPYFIMLAIAVAIITVRNTIWVYFISAWIYILYGLYNAARKALSRKQEKLVLKKIKKGL